MQRSPKANEVARYTATVNTDSLRVRLEPNTTSEILATMPEGEELEIVSETDGWVQVNIDGEYGYVSGDYVTCATTLADAMTMSEARYGQGVSDVRVDLVNYATQFVGNPYVWGGTSLTNGADCSGFVLSILQNTVTVCHILPCTGKLRYQSQHFRIDAGRSGKDDRSETWITCIP